MYYAIIFLPLLGAFISGFFGKNLGARNSEVITSGFLIISAILSWIALYNIGFNNDVDYIKIILFTWLQSGNLDISWVLRIDTLTAVMLVVVNTISSVVHVYSIGYMSHDPSRQRFFSYLSLFTFAMLMLVTSDNFMQLFFGWEGVGLASYLLIGFWHHKESANNAAMKAFIVNRIGDFGFALGIFAIFYIFGSLDFDYVFNNASSFVDTNINFLSFEINSISLICFLLFIGAMGKSAQFLLHTWLPDAMEGPTPVSALIHAATMVTAGVFLVARCSPLFELSQSMSSMIIFVGATTAFFAASVALVQNDIKKVIAYSTCSQLGYMFVAMGVGAYQIGMFHLFTHAFFKALLFLGAGSVIHAMSNEQDMTKMGGLRSVIPKTYTLMIIGTLSLTGFGIPGIFGMAGFYSKDAIIESAFMAHSSVASYAFWLLIAAALMTSFYSWRLIFLTFHGKSNASEDVIKHAHESPYVMLLPLVLLALGSIFAGIYFYDSFIDHSWKEFWGNSIFVLKSNHILEEIHHAPYLVKWAPTIAMIVGFIISYKFYIKNKDIPFNLSKEHDLLYNFLYNKWYFDELYNFIFVKPTMKIAKIFWINGDENIINKYGPDGIVRRINQITKRIVKIQTGFIYHYAFSMIIGVSIMITFYMFLSGN
ncbi:MAG: NADH-quinone oxidoreductase subunit L [Alphaproteobacteria bacterium]|jgi:NADH-quinone oxidoreductase subunit L|tara:strand:+ start:20674 stop:22626 length:1953 start_codon:yes stop_codon:yes gene_type:complete